jgi:hypothetical protein
MTTQTTSPSELLAAWLQTLRLGEPIRSRALAIIPVYGGDGIAAVAYRTLSDALASGEVLISEHAHASVPTLKVINQGTLPVLILDGDEVVGGLQNRVVNTTLLVPARSSFDLPVSCIEHGRWHQSRATFASGEAVHPSLRRQKVEQVTASFHASATAVADQAVVWSEVEASHRRTGTRSATAALRDGYVQRADELAEAERELHCPDDNPTGMIAMLEGRAVCADLFDRPAALRTYWSRLVRSYALEAVGARPDRAPRLDSAQRLLDRPLQAVRTSFASPGMGDDVRVTGNGVVGAALVYEASVLHAALFRRRQAPPRSELRSPSQRARRFES